VLKYFVQFPSHLYAWILFLPQFLIRIKTDSKRIFIAFFYFSLILCRRFNERLSVQQSSLEKIRFFYKTPK